MKFLLLFVVIMLNIPYISLNDENAAHYIYYQDNEHISHWFEWWYANFKGEKNFMVMFYTLGDLKNPFASLVGCAVFLFNENNSLETITSYPFINYSLDYEKCNVVIAGNRFYEKNGNIFIEYKKDDFELFLKIKPMGKKFKESSTVNEWQWMAWYVAAPYGEGEAFIKYKGEKYEVKGRAYHDHNWGMAKKKNFRWDWGEFNFNNEFAIIYGIVNEDGKIHFVNESIHISIPCKKIEYLEWKKINGIKKPTKLHVYGYADGKEVDFFIEMEKAYVIGIKRVGIPYLFGKCHGFVKIHGKTYSFSCDGFYEHRA